MKEKDLYFVGDIHGEYKIITWIITQQHKLKNADIVFLGDIGVGFCKPEYYNQVFEKINAQLEERNITYYFIRGNHDNKEYWDNESRLKPLSRIKFLKDHKVVELSGKTIYPVGGATSIDYEWRKKYNKEMEECYGSSKRVWWETEDIEKKYKDLPKKVDIIISHTSPLGFEPIIMRFSGEPEEVYNRDLENRKYLDHIFREVRCKYWYFGHYHTSLTGSLEDVIYKCLDINELYMFRESYELY